jgi:hypothetical protein
VPLHPSGASPQSNPKLAHVFGVQTPMPHWLGIVAPHTCMPAQLPHGSVFPQPSEMVPHLAPTAAHVVALQTHLLAVHEDGAVQLPQSSVPPHASSTSPHSACTLSQVFAGQ